MSISSTAVFEVRSDTGSDSNAGFFDPGVSGAGTDYTYPTSSPVVYSDLVIQSTTTQVSSVARPFTSADVGNGINITGGSGFTAARYTIQSVSGGIATLDSSCGTAASTGGVGVLGGALAGWNAGINSLVTGNTMYIRGGGLTYSMPTTANSMPSASSITGANSWTKVLGYASARGDAPTTDPARPEIVNSSQVNQLTLGAACWVAYIWFNPFVDSGGYYSNGIVTAGSPFHVEGCHITGDNNAQGLKISSGGGVVEGCLFDGANGLWLDQGSGYTIVRGNTFKNNLTVDYYSGGSDIIEDNLFVGCGYVDTNGNNGGNRKFINNTIDGASGHGIETSEPIIVYGNLITNCGGYGIYLGGEYSLDASIDGNAFYNNTSGNSNVRTLPFSRDITLTSSPYNSGAYTLNDAAGGGALLRGENYPTEYPGYTEVNNSDFGAYQHVDPTGGVGVITTAMNGGMG